MEDRQIKAEIKRLTKIFANIDQDKKDLCEQLVQNAAFMAVSLRELQEQIKKDGWVEDYQNGANQQGVKQSATLQSYNALIKNYTSVIKALSNVLPPAEKQTLPSVTSWLPREKTKEEIEEEVRREKEKADRIRRELEEAAEFQRRKREAESAKK